MCRTGRSRHRTALVFPNAHHANTLILSDLTNLTLGQLVARLEATQPHCPVVFFFDGKKPQAVVSYRGYYTHAAATYPPDDVQPWQHDIYDPGPTVKKLPAESPPDHRRLLQDANIHSCMGCGRVLRVRLHVLRCVPGRQGGAVGSVHRTV